MTIYGFYKDFKLVYIGQTILKIEDRIYKHFNMAKNKKDSNMPLIRSIAKYGKSAFTWRVLKTASTQEELNSLEIELIKKYNPRYNIQPGGKNSRLAASTRKKISEIQKKKIECIDDQICFFSVIEAEDFYNAGRGTIGRVAAGQRNSYKGKKFKFINYKISKDESAEINKGDFYRKP